MRHVLFLRWHSTRVRYILWETHTHGNFIHWSNSLFFDPLEEFYNSINWVTHCINIDSLKELRICYKSQTKIPHNCEVQSMTETLLYVESVISRHARRLSCSSTPRTLTRRKPSVLDCKILNKIIQKWMHSYHCEIIYNSVCFLVIIIMISIIGSWLVIANNCLILLAEDLFSCLSDNLSSTLNFLLGKLYIHSDSDAITKNKNHKKIPVKDQCYGYKRQCIAKKRGGGGCRYFSQHTLNHAEHEKFQSHTKWNS